MRIKKFVLVITLLLAGVAQAAGAHAGEARKIMSLSYSPSGLETEAQLNAGISEARLRTDLQQLAQYTSRIRTYSTDHGLERVPAIARELGLKVTLGIWLGKDRRRNVAAVEKAISAAAAFPDVVDRVLVGNEAVLRSDLPSREVISHMRRVKTALAGFGTQVSTGETWHIWLTHPELAAASDFVAAHILVYWDGVASVDAGPYFAQRFDELRKAFPNKKIVIAETGWPSGGDPRGGAVPSAQSQADVVRGFLEQAAAQNYDYNIVEAYDQPWKVIHEGRVGAFWGILTDDGKPKFALQTP